MCADITLVLYSYERILAEKTNADSDRLLPYEDPTPESVGDLENIVDKLDIQKCIMIATEARIDETRQQIAERLGDGSRTSLTVAIGGMLEVQHTTQNSSAAALPCQVYCESKIAVDTHMMRALSASCQCCRDVLLLMRAMHLSTLSLYQF